MLVSDWQTLYTFSLETTGIKNIPVTRHSFKRIGGILQISQSELLLSDQDLNCIYILTRHRLYSEIHSVIGKCEEQGGYIDGSYGEARFYMPDKFAKLLVEKDSYYVAERKHVRKLSNGKEEVSTIFSCEGLHRHGCYVVTALSVTKKHLYIAAADQIYQYSFTTRLTMLLSGGLRFGHADGHCLLATSYGFVSSMLHLDGYTMLVADFLNQNLRVIDTLSSHSSTICLPTMSSTPQTEHFYGSRTLCHIKDPISLFYSQNLKAVVVLSRSAQPILLPVDGGKQGRFYAANEYPTIARTMSITSGILRILRQIILTEDASVCFDEKQANFRV